jgi:hypothetical protein
MQRVPPDVAYRHAVKSIKDMPADPVISPALSTNGRSVIATRTFLDSASTTGCVRLAPTHPMTSPLQLHTTNSVRSPPSVFGIPDGHPAFGDTPFENAQAALLVSARVAVCVRLLSHKRNLIRLSSSLYLWCVLV